MDGPGTMTWEEFVENAESIIEISNSIDDHWQFEGDKNIPGQGYLLRREKTFISIDILSSESWTKAEEDLSNELCLKLREDPFEAPSIAFERPLVKEHHILWSMSYSVPVLYFNGWKSDCPGINPVSVEVAQKLLKNDSLDYSELSQAIHPILGTSFLYLHPCMSQNLIKITPKSKNKLISWLSMVAPAALNFKIRPEYYKLTFGDTSEADGNS
ncbi:ubiquitin-like-conjugating enzyme ATG10 isoform X2 [Leptopilina boulardi]|nr:ubiquitin-like-conjugating enzyme ATG10 isoform X2 [Leptopilina boulardi]XP_051167536.1 ubiquitin-like-conjugating enzyme ATG10 isoform X2 [Leptopilina boulardi]XP_051167537.1 ubiquitin-like-conjugating enzyme ATG10 isoform X2 [Leptopilina boulardi]XP_051167539.1 ubiquitin-like-conjugating enzyme ATG10 isoform X2 [Leptopilina boulardi]XP_051167540.1 ubiquitin-like-conjugating enzyme ATG10 isoform X2 [Leptopilina boulardi]XP_051167541.1 ubiquitin-like-conjugating enzyme ATG10 isoform X2 [Lep